MNKKNTFPHFTLGCNAVVLRQSVMSVLMFAVPAIASAQYEMTIHLKDGTKKVLSTEDIDSMTIEEKAEESAFNIELPEVSELYAKYAVAPKDENITYNVMYLEKSEFDKYASDADVVADDLKYYQELADGYGMTLSDILASFLMQGSWEDWCVPLSPDTEYVLWAYGLDSNGKQTTPLYKKVFATQPVSDKTDKTVAITLEEKDGNVNATFTPENPDRYYTAGYILKKDLAEGQTIEQNMQNSISSALYDYLASGEGVEGYLASSAVKGTTSALYEGLGSGSQGYIVAAFINKNGAVCSPVTVKAFGGAEPPMAAKPNTVHEKQTIVRHTLKRKTCRKTGKLKNSEKWTSRKQEL